MPTLTVSPNPAPLSTLVAVAGSGFANAKTRLLLDGAGATTNIFRPRKDGTFNVGITVASTAKTQTLVAQQLVGTTWSDKASVSVVVQAVVVPPPPVVTPPPPTSTYTFSDEFDGTALSSKWVAFYGPGDTGDRLDTDMMGNLSQVHVANGVAELWCERKATPSGRPFAGATMCTYGTFSQKYGTFETRMYYDSAKGTWPSWFFLPVGQHGPYPEIDAVEAYGDAACLGPGAFENVCYGDAGGPSVYAVVPITAGWHTHKFVWTASRVDFYMDGALTFSVTDPTKVPQKAMFPIYVWGVGANNASCRADATTPNLIKMGVDYIRISA